jgi:hypothetical protein
MRRCERGQGTVEWVGVVCLISLLLVGLLAAGVRVPGTALAQVVASRILCAAAIADDCDDEPALIAEYGTDVGELVRRHMPSLLFERVRGRFRSTSGAAVAPSAATLPNRAIYAGPTPACQSLSSSM